MLALLLVAASLGMSNFAASVGIGAAGADRGTRLRVGIIFGSFETGMPVLGLLLGHDLAQALGHAARWTGSGLLVAIGLCALRQAIRAEREAGRPRARSAGVPARRLLIAGFALSLDNLAVGFALGTYHVSLAVAAAVIGAVSVAMSLLGLELGHKLGARTGQRGELIGGLVLIGAGVALAAGVI